MYFFVNLGEWGSNIGEPGFVIFWFVDVIITCNNQKLTMGKINLIAPYVEASIANSGIGFCY